MTTPGLRPQEPAREVPAPVTRIVRAITVGRIGTAPGSIALKTQRAASTKTAAPLINSPMGGSNAIPGPPEVIVLARMVFGAARLRAAMAFVNRAADISLPQKTIAFPVKEPREVVMKTRAMTAAI